MRAEEAEPDPDYDGSAGAGDAQTTDTHRCDQGCDGCPHQDCEAYPVVDATAYTYCGAVATGVRYPLQIFWDDTLGSDERGDGTHENPVATEACARAIAKSRYWDGRAWDVKISHDIL